MASRKKTLLPRRTGLRSQRPQQPEEMATGGADLDWETDVEDEDTSWWRPAAPTAPAPTAETGGELVDMMRDFLAAQQRREEGLLAEIRGLRASLPSADRLPQPAVLTHPRAAQPLHVLNQLPAMSTPSTATATSPRLDLPTPAPRRMQRDTPREVSPAASIQFPGASSRSDQPRSDWRPYSEPRIPQYENGEDIENYLLRFERIAKTWHWPEDEWACRLVPLLSGKALEAYTAMDEERAHWYPDLKTALLAKFDISPETYRQQFRSMTTPPGENPTETYHRLRGFYRRWTWPEQHTKEQIGEIIILEQLLRVLPPEVRTWVKEHEPAEGLIAARLALQYLNARRGGPASRSTSAAPRPTYQPPQTRPGRREYRQEVPGTSTAPNQQASGKDFVCYYCQQPGHKASVCPIRKAKVSGACYAPRPEVAPNESKTDQMQHHKTVSINGQQVTALLDTGSFTSLIKHSLVPAGCVDYSRQTDILCVHGDKHPYPRADVTITIDEQPYLLTVGVVQNLPVDMILGWDLPVLMDLLHNKEVPVEPDFGEGNVNASCPVITRAQAKGVQPLPDLDSSLCEGGTKGPNKTRRQRRFEKQLRQTEPKWENVGSKEMWEVPHNIAELQRGDKTLKLLFPKVGEEANGGCVGREMFSVENDVLYTTTDEHKRLVIPASCRPLIMHLAHTLPWAGHLGRNKTYLRLNGSTRH
ncbi:uncharacterized protein LOC131968014 [Centropristis striata]|uniref:uncharacterized protein LOC131968014 n=1 Tax=Centropristis striata TaxID=184440 RepID=UPI0027E0DB66|nr:uncharacterized protein LOC131968014 [Centropristis striata]